MSNYFDEDSDADEEDGEGEAEPYVDENAADTDAPELGPTRPSDGDTTGYFDEDSEQDNSDQDEEGQFPIMADQDRSKDREELAAANSMYTTPLNENALPRRKPTLESMDVDEDADYYSAYGLGTSGRGLGSTAYDSDDDEDEGQSTILIDKGTHKNKRAQLGRFDFDTEEGFNRYKDTVEVVPKTSFQFGVKMSEGRKTGKWDDGKNKGLSKDEKLDRDWQRISRLMEKNRGGGGKGEASSAGGNTGGGGGNGGGDNRAKRRKSNR